MRIKPSSALFMRMKPFAFFMRDNWGLLGCSILLALLTGLGVNFLPPGYVMVFSLPLLVYAVLLWPSSANIKGEKVIYVYMAYLIVFGVWPQFSSYKVPGLPALEPQRMLFAAVILSVAGCLVIGADARRRYLAVLFSDAKVPALLIVALFAIHGLAAFGSQYPSYSVFLVIREFLTTASIFFAAFLFVNSVKDVERCYAAIVFSALMVSLIALLESVLKKNLFASWVPLSSEYALWATMERVRDGEYRVQATFDNPLLLVDYLVCILPIAVYGAVYQNGRLLRFMHFAAMILIPLALVRTGSRSAYLALALQIGLIALVLFARRTLFQKNSYFSLLALVVVVVVPILVLPFLGEIMALSGKSAEQAMSTSARLSMFRNAVNFLLGGNIFGVGFGRAPEAVGVINYMGGAMGFVLDNYFVTIVVDSGLLALVLFAALGLWALFKNIKVTISDSGKSGALGASLLVSVVGFLLMKGISSQTQVFPIFYSLLVFTVIAAREAKSKNV